MCWWNLCIGETYVLEELKCRGTYAPEKLGAGGTYVLGNLEYIDLFIVYYIIIL